MYYSTFQRDYGGDRYSQYNNNNVSQSTYFGEESDRKLYTSDGVNSIVEENEPALNYATLVDRYSQPSYTTATKHSHTATSSPHTSLVGALIDALPPDDEIDCVETKDNLCKAEPVDDSKDMSHYVQNPVDLSAAAGASGAGVGGNSPPSHGGYRGHNLPSCPSSRRTGRHYNDAVAKYSDVTPRVQRQIKRENKYVPSVGNAQRMYAGKESNMVAIYVKY